MAFNSMLEVNFVSPDKGFQIVRETLTRIGTSKKDETILRQICYLLHKKGRYYICHYKELNQLDGVKVTIDDDDLAKRNLIASLLVEWKLVSLIDPDKYQLPMANFRQVKIIPHSAVAQKSWTLDPYYRIGVKN